MVDPVVQMWNRPFVRLGHSGIERRDSDESCKRICIWRDCSLSDCLFEYGLEVSDMGRDASRVTYASCMDCK